MKSLSLCQAIQAPLNYSSSEEMKAVSELKRKICFSPPTMSLFNKSSLTLNAKRFYPLSAVTSDEVSGEKEAGEKKNKNKKEISEREEDAFMQMKVRGFEILFNILCLVGLQLGFYPTLLPNCVDLLNAIVHVLFLFSNVRKMNAEKVDDDPDEA